MGCQSHGEGGTSQLSKFGFRKLTKKFDLTFTRALHDLNSLFAAPYSRKLVSDKRNNMSHQLLDSLSDEEGENLLPSNIHPAKVVKALGRDINALVEKLERKPEQDTDLEAFFRDGEMLKQSSKTRDCELVWAEVRSDILSFYTGVRDG